MLPISTSVFWFFIGFSYLRTSFACTAPRSTNFTRPPRYWCKMDTQVSITTACDNEIEETITVPWTTGMVDRFVPTDEKQNIEDLTAYRIVNGQRIRVYSRVHGIRRSGNAVLSVRAASTPKPVTILIKYKTTGAVQGFSHCSGMGNFVKKNSSLENSLMVSKWAVGGQSIEKVLRVKVRFVLRRDQQLEYVDTLTTVPDVFTHGVENQANDTEKPVNVLYNGMTTGVTPSEMFFYIRFFKAFGLQSCPLSRNCEAENRIFKESKLRQSNHRMIIGLVWGLGLAILIISVVTWVCCCKRIRAKRPDTNFDEDVPTSLTHFVQDTGDDDDSQRRKVWTDSDPKSGGKEEFYALDLSPRGKDKKGSLGF